MRYPFAALLTAAGFALSLVPAVHAQTAGTITVRPRTYRAPAGENSSLRMEMKRQVPGLRYSLALPATYSLPPLEEKDLVTDTVSYATRAGLHRAIEPRAPRTAGRWQTLDTGRKLWRMVIQSPGAAGLRLHLTGFNVGRGRLWLHDGSGDENEIMGPYSGRGLYEDGEFWTDFVHSEKLVIEYEPEGDAEEIPFTIGEVSHMFAGVLPALSELPAAAQRDRRLSLLPDLLASPGTERKSTAASCHLDINCYPEWAETAKSVGHIVYESRGSTYVCSGTLLGQRNGGNVPYFLTADHCISADAEARTVQAYWFYQTSRCNGPAVTRAQAQRTLGARYLVSGGPAQGDFALIQMNSIPNGVTFSGWSATTVPIGSALVGIHHPTGDYKRFSRGNRVATRSGIAGANLARYVSPAFAEGLVEPGSSGSGLFSEPGVLVGNLSSGPKTDTQEQACAIKPFTANYGALATYYDALASYLDNRGGAGGGGGGGATTPPGNPPPNPTGNNLQPGVPATFTIEPVSGPTLIGGDSSFRLTVPANASRLEIKLTTAAGAQVAFFVRKDTIPVVTNGRVTADAASPGNSGNETLVLDAQSQPALTAGTYYIALAVFSANLRVQGSLTATLTTSGSGGGGGGGGTVTPPPPGGTVLVSGRATRFSLPPVTGGRLINGNSGFRVVVPAGARRLDIKIATDNPAHDIDLYVRFGEDVVLNGQNLVADHRSTGDAGNEEIGILPTTQPPLRTGTYFIALGQFVNNVTVNGTITATVTTDGGGGGGGTQPPPPPPGGNQLISGTPRNFSIPAASLPTLVSGAQAYQIVVPQNATRLDVRLATATPNADLDLYVRYGAPPEIQGDRIVADFTAAGPTGTEAISVAPNTNPALRAGTYYVAIAVFTKGVPVSGTITATTATAGGGGTGTTPPGGTGTVLRPSVSQNFTITGVEQSTLLNGTRGFYVQVPAGATRLELALRTVTPNVDLDLFVRKDTDPLVQNGKVQADFSSTGPVGNESVVINTASNPPLRAGTYFVAVGVFSAGVTINSTLTATIDGATGSVPNPPGGPVILRSGQAYGVGLEAVTAPTLFTGSNAYAIDVPDNAVRLEIRLSTQTPGVDVDLFARYNTPVVVSSGRVAYDHISDGPTGNEVITVINGSQPTLRPGRYHIGLAQFTTGTPTTATLTATVIVNAPAQTAVHSRLLSPDAPSKFSLPAVDSPTLFHGDFSYRVNVPEGVRRMRINVDSDVPSIDVDVYARYERDNDLDGEGGVATDHASEGETGNEVLRIGTDSEPPLRAGTYWISLANFTAGEPATGQISIEFEREVSTPSLSSARTLQNGAAQRFELSPVSSPTLFGGERGYRFDVPSGRGTLEIIVKSDNPAVDVDLYARYGAEPDVVDGRVVADYRATGDTGDEAMVIHRMSIPALRAGSYFFGLALYSTGAPASGTITARFISEETLSQPAGGSEPVLVKSRRDEAQPLGSALGAAKPGWEVRRLLPSDAKDAEGPVLLNTPVPDAVPAAAAKRTLTSVRQQ